MDAAVVVASSSVHNNGGATVVVPVPAGAVAGDWIVVGLVCARVAVPDVAGWSAVVPATTIGSRSLAVLVRPMVAGDTSYTVTFSGEGGVAATATAVRGGVAPASWVVGAFGSREGGHGSPTETVAPSLTRAAGGRVLAFIGEATNATEDTSALKLVGADLLAQVGGGSQVNYLAVGVKPATGAGPSGAVSMAFPNAHAANSGGVQVMIPGVPSQVADPGTVRVRTADGMKPGKLRARAGAALSSVKTAYRIRPGRTVPELLDGRRFVVAHRGGSTDWAEMSRQGYTQCVAVGAHALEFSLARTSDGVWIGVHDETLDRVTGGASKVRPNELTWAQIQGLKIVQPPKGRFGPRPFARIEEIIADYSASHTIFVDPKYVPGTQWPELFAILANVPDAKNRFVFKFYCTGTSVAKQARANGYKSWGYYYPRDLDVAGRLEETAPFWDILGMTHDAAKSYWDTILAVGKPVMGHICENAASAEAALSKGAAGVMAAGITSVMQAQK